MEHSNPVPGFKDKKDPDLQSASQPSALLFSSRIKLAGQFPPGELGGLGLTESTSKGLEQLWGKSTT